MRKLILLLFAVQSIYIANAQWAAKTIDNKVDPIYKVAFTKEYNHTDLRMQMVDNRLVLYLAGKFWCEGTPILDLSFFNGNKKTTYSGKGTVVGEFRNVISISFDLELEDFFEDFRKADELKIIIVQEDCPKEFYKYNVEGFNYVVKSLKKQYD